MLQIGQFPQFTIENTTTMQPEQKQQKSLKQKGTQQFKNKNYHKALQHYNNYIREEHDDNIQTMLNIAFCYFKLEEYESAISMCDQIIDIDEKYYKCYYRRAMSRKEILDKDPNNMMQRYRLYYDCLMFKKYCDQKGLGRELEDFEIMAKNCKEIITPCQPVRISPFQRSLIELEKENINMFAISELQQKYAPLENAQKEDHRQHIDRLYREMIKVKREVKDTEELKVMVELIQDKIKLIRKQMQSNKEKIHSKNEQQKSVTTDTKQSKEDESSKLDAIVDKLQNETSVQVQTQPLLKLEKQEQKNQSSNTVKQEVKKQAQKEQQLLVEVNPKKLEQPEQNKLAFDQHSTAQSLVHQIKQQMSKSRDAFKQFSIVLTNILKSSQINTITKQELLKLLPKQIVNFKITLKGIPKPNKAQLNEAIKALQLTEETRQFYIK